MVYTGTAFAAPHLFKWGYNERNELATADRNLGTDPDSPGNVMTPGDYDFTYDPIGNRTETNVDNDQNPMTYTRNSVNQYTATTYPTESLTYDDDGNLTSDGKYRFITECVSAGDSIAVRNEGRSIYSRTKAALAA